MGQESSLGQARLTLIEYCEEYVGSGDRVRSLEFGAIKDVVERGLNCGCTG